MHTYRNPADISPLLSERAGDPGRVFLVPSNRDRPLLLDMFSVPGERTVWIWDDLYRALLDAGAGEKPRAQIDPPDHWLLLRTIVRSLRERFTDSLPPGTFSDGFLDLAGQAVRELLREDVPPDRLAESLGCAGCPSGNGCSMLDDESGSSAGSTGTTRPSCRNRAWRTAPRYPPWGGPAGRLRGSQKACERAPNHGRGLLSFASGRASGSSGTDPGRGGDGIFRARLRQGRFLYSC